MSVLIELLSQFLSPFRCREVEGVQLDGARDLGNGRNGQLEAIIIIVAAGAGMVVSGQLTHTNTH